MLAYTNSGERSYNQKKVRIYRRNSWEFQLIYNGTAVYTEKLGNTGISSDTLVVSRPDSWHGWDAPSGTVCQVAVAHFTRVPYILEELMISRKKIILTLGEKGKADYLNLHRQLTSFMLQPGKQNSAECEKILLETLLLILDKTGPQPLGSIEKEENRIVANAVEIFRDQMGQGITVADAADQLGYSPAHLRRLFHQEKNRSPNEVFKEMKMKEAFRLLKEPGARVTEVGILLGFNSLSAFTRAYKNYYGHSPASG